MISDANEKYSESFVQKLFVKGYDELGVYVIGISLLVCAIINTSLHNDLVEASKTGTILFLFFFFSISGFGIALSMFHVLSKAKKDAVDKYLMIFFAISVQGLTAFVGFDYARETSEVSLVFPFLNGIYAFISISLFFEGKISHRKFHDNDATLIEIIISTLIVLILVSITTFLTSLHWVEILSVAILFGNKISSSSHYLKAQFFTKNLQ